MATTIARVRGLRRRGRLNDAVELATIAIAGHGSDLADLLIERGELLALLGEDGRADADLVRAVQSSDPHAVVRALVLRSALARFGGRMDLAKRHVARAGRIVAARPEIDPLAAGRYHLEAGLCGLEQDDPGAAAQFERALERVETVPVGAIRDGLMTGVLEGRAALHLVRGDMKAARADLDRALPLGRRSFGRGSLEVAQLLNARGMVGKFEGAFKRAARDYQRARRIVEARVGPDHLEMAAVLHNIAGLEHAKGAWDKAETPARESLAIRIRALGPKHVAVALDRSGLGSILDRLERRDEAQAELELALPILRATLGPRHREVAVALNNLAAIAQGRGDLDAAETLYREALEIKEAALGPLSPSVGITLSNLASVVHRRGDDVSAADLSDRAIAILSAAVAPDHPALRTARSRRERIARLATDVEPTADTRPVNKATEPRSPS